jgi:hypothetical protein
MTAERTGINRAQAVKLLVDERPWCGVECALRAVGEREICALIAMTDSSVPPLFDVTAADVKTVTGDIDKLIGRTVHI